MEPWPFWLAAVVLAALGMVSALCGLFADRSRGRWRCLRCGFDMSNSGMVCPECGRRHRSNIDLQRTRRHWRWVVAGGVLLAAAGPLSMHAILLRTEGGWWRIAPTFVLIRAFERSDSDDIRTAVSSRIAPADPSKTIAVPTSLSDTQWEGLVVRCEAIIRDATLPRNSKDLGGSETRVRCAPDGTRRSGHPAAHPERRVQ